MRKIIPAIFLMISGCAVIDNPYEGLSSRQLSRVSSPQLCDVSNSSSYKPSDKVKRELARRGYKDCSRSEVFCRDTLSLKPGTKAFADCRIQRDQYLLDRERAQIAAIESQRPVNVYVYPPY